MFTPTNAPTTLNGKGLRIGAINVVSFRPFPSREIAVDARQEGDRIRAARVAARTIGAEGGDLDHLVFAATAKHHMDDAKTLADDEGTAKRRLDLLWGRIGGHIKIFGFQTQQQVTHSATDDVGFKAALLQCAHHIQGALVDPVHIDAVHLDRHFDAFAQKRLVASGLFAHQLMDELFDHCLGNSSKIGQPFSRATARRVSSGLVATGWLTRSTWR